LAVPAVLSLWHHNWLTVLCVGALCFMTGAARGTDMLRQLALYTQLHQQKVVLVGRATDDGVYGDRSQLTFTLDHVSVVSPRAAALPGAVSVRGFGAPAVYRGDLVQVSGKLFKTRGGNQAGVSFAQLKVLASDPSPIDTFRREFAAGMQSALPEPLASFGLGLLIGQRSTLPEDTKETLLMVGLTHIIAVSGYNLTIMVEVARRLCGKRSKFQTAVACLTLIGVFLLITGNSPSIVRASIISVLGIAAWYYGRTIKPLVLLLTAGAITVAANPLYLWGNVGWYLSFLAFFGVLVVGPIVIRRLYGERKPPLLIQILLESLCAEIMTLPYVLYIFGQLSLMALPANVLVVALVPLAMLLGLLAGLGGMLLPAFAGWFAWPANLLLTYMLDVARLLSRVPHAFIENIGFSLPMMLGVYAVVGTMTWLAGRKVHVRRFGNAKI